MRYIALFAVYVFYLQSINDNIENTAINGKKSLNNSDSNNAVMRIAAVIQRIATMQRTLVITPLRVIIAIMEIMSFMETMSIMVWITVFPLTAIVSILSINYDGNKNMGIHSDLYIFLANVTEISK